MGVSLSRLPPDVKEWLTFREMTLCCTSSVAFVLLMVATLAFPDMNTNHMDVWRHRAWEQVQCSVQQAGMTYLGDCHLTLSEKEALNPGRVAPAFAYGDCEEEDVPESCIEAVDEAFQAVGERRLSPAAGLRRLRAYRKRNTELCQDSFSPWALVQIVNMSHLNFCGYPTGLLVESATLDFGEASRHYDSYHKGNYVDCWVLALKGASGDVRAVDRCTIVAMEDPQVWPVAEVWEDGRYRLKEMIAFAALVFGSCAAATLAFYEWCGSFGGLFDPHEDEEEVEDEDGDESERVRFVQNHWSLFRTNVLAEYTQVSARDVDMLSTTECVGPFE